MALTGKLEKVHRVLIVDDHPLCRKGVASIIRDSGDLVTCSDAHNGREALTRMRADHPDVIIMDISMPGQNGLELLKMIKAERPEIPILILTVHQETIYAVRALKAGAHGYILKGDSGEEILNALRRVLAGELYLSPRITHELIMQAIQALDAGTETRLKLLTRKESEVFEAIGRGLSTAQIAAEMNLSVKTIETHRMHIKEKLLCMDTTELANFATEWRIFREPEVVENRESELQLT